MVCRILVPIAVAAILCLTGCRPKVEPVSADFRRLSLQEMKYGTIELTLSNPNHFPLDIDSLYYALILAADTVASGRRPMPIHIGAADSTRADFPFELKLGVTDIISQLPRVLSDTVWLRLNGRYRLPGPIGRYRLPFSYIRSVPLAEEVRKLVERIKGALGD
ncbi:MAG: LEA type 2 family protein [candidate division WOR-3 bacterium]